MQNLIEAAPRGWLNLAVQPRRRQRDRAIATTLPSTSLLAFLGACGGGGAAGVAPIPPAPTITSQSDSVSTTASSIPTTGNVLANDSVTGGATLTVTGVSIQNGSTGTVGQPLAGPLGTLTIGENGAYTFEVGQLASLPGGQSSTTTYVYSPSAGGAAGTPQTLTISVTGMNDAPVAGAVLGNASVTEGSTLTVLVPANAFIDPDSSATFSLSAGLASGAALPGWLTFDTATARLSAAPGFSDSGSYVVRIIATDNVGATGFQDFRLDVMNTLTGVVADGYLASATVFIDVDGDGRVSAGEPFAIADSQGRFALITDIIGPLKAVNGINTDSGVANTLTLTAPAGSSVINPLTTLFQTLVATGATASAAEAAVKVAFGISASVDLSRYDILAAPAGDAGALSAQKAATIVAATLQEAKDFAGGDGLAAEKSVLSSLAAIVATSKGPIDLTRRDVIEQVYAGSFKTSEVMEAAARAANVNAILSTADTLAMIATRQAAVAKNSSPVVVNDNYEASEDKPFTFDPLANDSDADKDTLTVTLVDGRSMVPGSSLTITNGGLFMNTDGSITFTPRADYFGQIVLEYVVTDGRGGSGKALAVINVADAADMPTAQPDLVSVTEDVGSPIVTGNVLTNDVDPDNGATLTIKAASAGLGSANAPPGTLLTGTYGTLTITTSGSYTYTLNNADNDTQALMAGQVGSEIFTYQVTDGTFSTLGQVRVSVNGTADEPRVQPMADTLLMQAFSGFTAINGVNLLANDQTTAGALTVKGMQREDGTTGTVGQALSGTYGSLTVQENGSYLYTLFDNAATRALAYGQAVTETFLYQPGSATLNGAFTPLTITVRGGIVAPSGGTVTGSVTTTDPATGGPFTYGFRTDSTQGVLGQPLAGKFGSLTLNANGTFSYTTGSSPAFLALREGELAYENFSLQRMGSITASISTFPIAVRGANDAPTAVNDSGFSVSDTSSGAFVSGNVKTNDSDPEAGSTLTVAAVNGSAASVSQNVVGTYGKLHLLSSGQFTYQLDRDDPDTLALALGQSAVETFNYTISDGSLSSTANISINVTGGNNAPTLTLPTYEWLSKGSSDNAVLGFSSDGSKILFRAAGPLVGGDANNFIDIYTYDVASGIRTLVSTTATGTPGNSGSLEAVISADGKIVAFATLSTNFTANDLNDRPDIFVRNLTDGSLTLASSSATGQLGNGLSFNPTLSPDGSLVAFASVSTNLVADDVNAASDIFLKNLATGAISLVSITASGTQANGESTAPVFSPDGTRIAFYTRASNLSGATGDALVIKDLASGSLSVIDTGSSTGNDQQARIAFSAEGSKLVFGSFNRLSLADTNSSQDIYLKDFATGRMHLVSKTNGGAVGNAASQDPSISADGTKVLFSSSASNLVPNDSNGTADLFLKDLTTGAIQRLSVPPNGAQLFDGGGGRGYLSGDANRVAWASSANNLVPGDTASTDVFLVRPSFFEVQQGGTTQASGSFTFTDLDSSSYTLSIAPLGSEYLGGFSAQLGSATTGGGTISWSYDLGPIGSASISSAQPVQQGYALTVLDNHGGNVTQVIHINVRGANDAPVAVADALLFLAEDDSANMTRVGNVLANDTDVDLGTVLQVATVGGAAGNVGQTLRGIFGDLIVRDDGTFTYTLDNADPDTNALSSGQTAFDIFNYAATDGFTLATSTLTIEIHGHNDFTG